MHGISLGLFGAAALVFAVPVARAGEWDKLVSEHCLDCHDDATRKGKLSLESLGKTIRADNAAMWLKALEQVERGAMPPSDKAELSAAERHAAVLDLEAQLVAHAESNAPAQQPTVLRRLNRVEYRKTIRDLLHLDLETSDPTRDFPEDTRVHGFATHGGKLVTSGFLLRQYLNAAEDVVSRAVHFEPRPEVRRWELLPPFVNKDPGYQLSEAAYLRKKTGGTPPYQDILERADGAPKAGYYPVDDLREGVPVSGWYLIRIRAEGKFRYADMDLKKFRFPPLSDPANPLRLSLFSGSLLGMDPSNKDSIRTAARGQQAGERELATWDLPDDGPAWLECRVWLDRGHFPKMVFPNGPTGSNNRILSYVTDNKYTLLGKEQLEEYEREVTPAAGDGLHLFFFETPRIRLYNIQVEGPLNEFWPPASHVAVFGERGYEAGDAPAILRAFAEKAWRRPVSSAEVESFVQLVKEAEAQGQSRETSIQKGLKAVLCSPQFLYREETPSALKGHEIAARLSYFLWSSMPDEALLKRAAAGELARPEVRRAEAARLLADQRSDVFVEEFLNGWLDLKKLGSMAPHPYQFGIYYSENLEPAMRAETRLFFKHLLRTNGPVAHLLDSDYSFINQGLAKLYGIAPAVLEAGRNGPVDGLEPGDLAFAAAGHAPSLGFARVSLGDPRRGGLLGQGSVLTLTANGVDTSPVIRGIWVLERLLGAPPSPPPADVPKVEPDIRGASTIREQLEKHRESAACKSCHRQIDPPGFALENFDPIGRWRAHYMKGEKPLPIDATGRFGEEDFKDIVGFKKGLVANQERVARSIVEHLLLCALGRELNVTDRPHIRRILEGAAPGGYRLRELVLLCAESELLCRK